MASPKLISTPLNHDLKSSAWNALVERWRISVEDYHRGAGIVDTESAVAMTGRAYAIYAEVQKVGRVVLFVVTRETTTRYVDEVIEACLDELDPVESDELKQDVAYLLKILCFSSCEQLAKAGTMNGK